MQRIESFGLRGVGVTPPAARPTATTATRQATVRPPNAEARRRRAPEPSKPRPAARSKREYLLDGYRETLPDGRVIEVGQQVCMLGRAQRMLRAKTRALGTATREVR
ncbi:hypothetical protein [Streptomyces sp. NPDC054829]